MTTRQIYNRLIEVKFNLAESPNIPKPELNKLNSLIREIDDKATREALSKIA